MAQSEKNQNPYNNVGSFYVAMASILQKQYAVWSCSGITELKGVVVTNTRTKKRFEGIAVAKQYFHPIPEAVIDELIKQVRLLRGLVNF